PLTDPPTARINEERALYWLSQGAQPSEAVARLLEKQGTLDRFARLRKGEDLETLLAEAAKEVAPAEEIKEAPPEISLAELGLSKRVQSLLEGARVTNAREILAKLEEGEEGLLSIKGFGPKSLAEVREKLRAHGLVEA
ncbi:MAG: DNA-directed RNA polymerase subunit alpha C-terminal domain-containing protein, partial [Chloroflexota bacterium]|nr:DNA-directed RNA polymerase subunit alpha C-terminal domain-containing protein [Chloroflexota bacterium]